LKKSVFVSAADNAYDKASAAIDMAEDKFHVADEALRQIANISDGEAMLALLELEAALDNGEKLLDEAEEEAYQ
jgi:hypothetical protein